jgi:hypothetical protein
MQQVNASYWKQNWLKKIPSQTGSLYTYGDWDSPSLFFVKGGKPSYEPNYSGIENSLAAVFVNYLGPNGRCTEYVSHYSKNVTSYSTSRPLQRVISSSSLSQNIMSQILNRNLGLDLLKKPLFSPSSVNQSFTLPHAPSLNLTTVLPVLNSPSPKSPLLTQ